MALPFTITGTLYEGDGATLYRAVGGAAQGPVILKVLDPRRCRPKALERQRAEYELGRTLDLPTVARPLALATFQGMPALVLEDFGGQPLDRVTAEPMPVDRFLALAVRIASAVADIHRQGVVHKDLKPENILVNVATAEVKLADFGLASRLPREPQGARPPHLIEGSLPYMSPEQTGRMNRAVDSRTDLYSLGVTFFQMLTRRLPFEAADPLEWVHCHVARPPPSPAEIVSQVPETVANIVLKLLAKRVEDRYQSARGLQHDLERCLAQWSARGDIEPFLLGGRDVPDRLQIPQKLYGRDAEIAALCGAFDRVVETGRTELLLVSGYSGIGKSSVVRELQKPLVRERGLFLTDKFDQLARGAPYSTVVRALTDLVLALLAEDELRLREWRQEIQKALGINGKLVVDVIPPLKLLIGEQPPVSELPATEEEQRFRRVFRDFLAVFTTREHPLVLFLDDLQWADAGSLGLIEDLITQPDTHHLLLIGAYRDNEVGASHPLVRTLERIRKTDARVTEVVLSPLRIQHVVELVADTVHADAARASGLAALVHEKTGGNPFFVIQFLTTLHQEQLLEFEEAALTWRWDTERIREKGYTDNVIDFMARRLTGLPAATQDALRIAACLGHEAAISLLALAHGKPEEDTLRDLFEAFREGLILRSHDSYAFAHDRIQQAACSLIPEPERAAVHLHIGRLLLERTPPEAREEKIFEIANQLDRGAPLITSREERERVAELDLAAARRARASSAHASALQYLAAGRALLADDCWERRYELTFALELLQAECEYLTGELSAAEERLSMLARRAGGHVDAAAVACAQVALYTTMGRFDRGVGACLDYLGRVGIRWSPHPTAEDVREEYDRLWRRLGSRAIEELIDLPTIADPEWRATMDVLMWCDAPALFTDKNLFRLVLGRMANLSLEHGNSDAACLGYVWLGTMLGPDFGDYRTGFRFGKLGFDLLEKRGLLRFKAQAYLGFGNRISPWTRHVRSAVELVRRAFDTAQETGNLTYASYACNCLITLLLAEGDPLGDVQRETERALAFVQKAKFGLVADILTGQLRLMRTLRGLTPSLSSFDDADFEEARFERHLEEDARLAIAACWYWIRKLQARVHAGDVASALDAMTKAQALLWTSTAFFEVAEYHFYGALALAAHHDGAPAEARAAVREAVLAHHRQLEIWAENCPENFASRAALVGAEIARIDGRHDEAMRRYDEAIRSARENGFVQDEALASELASRFYRARGFELIADAYLREARSCYGRWGADGKVKQLDEQHPRLVEQRIAFTTSLAARAEQLDLLSVAKGSQTISGEIVLEDLLRTLLQVVLEQGGAQSGCLLLSRDGDLWIEAEATVDEKGVRAAVLQSLPLASSSALVPVSIVRYVQRTRERVILDAASGAERFSPDEYIARRRPRSLLCLPILRQAEVVGVLVLENDLLAGVFTPERLVALELLATQAAISVENASLLAKERAARAAAEEAKTRAAFLAEVGPILSESLDYEETLRRLARVCVRSIAEWCVIDILQGGEIHRIAGAHADPAKEPLLEQLQRRYPPSWDSPHPSARVLREGEPLLFHEMSDEDVRRSCQEDAHARIIHALGTRSAVVVPLVARGRTLGVISLSSSSPRRYGRADLELAQELAHRAAIAVDNAGLYREAQEAIRLRDEFLSIASHELYTPITSLMLSLDAMLPACRTGQALDPVATHKLLDLVSRQGRRLVRLIADLLDVSRIETGRLLLDLADVDLVALAREVAERLEPDLARSRCSLSIRADGPVTGRWDRSRLDQVVTNLLSNAMKFGSGRPIEVSIGAETELARLVVADRGIGISPARQARVFERFERAASAQHYGGLGLGLYISRRIVEAHGGSIRVASEPEAGSTFTVDLPLAGGTEPGGPHRWREE